MNKLLTKIVGAALGVAMTVGVGVAVASSNKNIIKTEANVGDETTLLDVSSASKWSTSTSSYTSDEWDDDVPDNTFAFASNNQKGWAYVKLCPGKNKTNTSYIKCNTATSSLTSSVEITVVSNDSATFSNVKLFVYSDSGFSTQVDETTYNEDAYAQGTMTFSPSSSYQTDVGENWASGVYFKFSITIKNTSTSKNYGTNISKIVAIEGAEASSTSCDTIELTNYPTSNFGVGEKVQLSYSALDSNGDTWNGDVTYDSTNKSVATVSATGLLTAVGVGTTTISVQDTDGNADPDEKTVTVVANYFYPVTSQHDLIDGAKIVVIGQDGGNYYALNDTVTSYKCGTNNASVTTFGGKTVVVPSDSLITWTVGISNDKFTLLSSNNKYLRGYVYNNTTPEVITSATSTNTGNKWSLSANTNAGYNLVSDQNVFTYLYSTSSFDGSASEQNQGVYLYQLCKGTPSLTKVVPSTASLTVNTSTGSDSFTFSKHPSYASGTVTAFSGDTDVVTVSTSNSTVTVTPIGNGSTTITFKDQNNNTLLGSVSITSTYVVSYDSLSVTGNLGGAPYYVGDKITSTEMSGLSVYGVKAGQADTLLTTGYTLSADPSTLTTAGSSITVRVTASYDANPAITGYKDFTITVNEKPYAPKLTSLSDLWDGQEVYIGDNSERAWPHYSTGNNIQTTAISNIYDSTKGLSVRDSSAAAFTVGRVYDANAQSTYWTFSYIVENVTYYLYSSASGSNYMKATTTLSNTCYWTIAASTESGQWSIHNVGNNTRYMQTNGNFLSCYTNNQTDPYLYLTTVYSASAVAESFKQNALHFADYDPEKTTEGTNNGAGWCSDDNHGYYAHAKRVWNAMDSSERAAADTDTLNRLSAWASANGDVLNGTNTLSARVSVISTINNTGLTVMIVAIAMLTLTSIGTYHFLRKRKEQ